MSERPEPYKSLSISELTDLVSALDSLVDVIEKCETLIPDFGEWNARFARNRVVVHLHDRQRAVTS